MRASLKVGRIVHAFTLLEMLVVLAITAVLLGIIIVPVIQSFNFTRAAESLSEQQQRGRILVDEIARDIASGTAIGDNEGTNGETIISIPTPTSTTPIEIPIYYSRIDIYKAARGGATAPGGGFIGQNGHIDPTLQGPNGQVIYPAAQGQTIVRYFVWLRHPFTEDASGNATGPIAYNNPYDNVLEPLTATNVDQQENLYVLYRFEFQPYIVSGGTASPNTTYFKTDPTNPNAPYLNDPYFCELSTHDTLGWGGTSGEKTAQLARVTQIFKHSTIVTEESRFDMIQPLYDLATRKPLLDASGNPRILSLIQFRPSPVAQEPAVGANPISLGDETTSQSTVNFPDLGIAPNVLRTQMAEWSGEVFQVNPYNGSLATFSTISGNDYLTCDTRSNAPALPGSTSPATVQNLLMLNAVATTGLPANLVLFDLNVYDTAVNDSIAIHYPFSEAISAAETEDGVGNDWLSLGQTISFTQDPSTTFSYRDEFIPFDYNPHSGQINTGFNISSVGNPAAGSKNPDNVPQASTSGIISDATLPAMIPSEDTSSAVPGTNFYNPDFASINELFNVAYNQYSGQTYLGVQQLNLRPYLHRFIDLRLQPELDGWASPMDPDPSGTSPLAYPQNGGALNQVKTPWITGWTGFDNVTIVPGSEEVVGPDQNQGSNHGLLVRYVRVTSDPGPNQYRINYTNLQEPADYSQLNPPLYGSTDPQHPNLTATPPIGPNNQHYDAFLGQWVLNPGMTIDTHDPLTMLIQPQYKVGYVEFDSDPNVALPIGSIKVSYKFQFNRPADAFSVSYDSRQVINVLLGLRTYPQASNLPNAQTITLQASAPVKNFIR